MLSSIIVIVIVIRTCTPIPCTHSYPDSIIDYISNNINIDPSIYYLGTKASTNECQNSCIDFNYLCNASSNSIIYSGPDVDYWQFNHAECSVTALGASYENSDGSILLLTSDLVSKEYILEAQLSIIASSDESGIVFKSDAEDSDSFLDYYYGIHDRLQRIFTGYESDASYATLSKPQKSIARNTKHNVSVRVNNNQFTTYFNGEEIFTSNVQQINPSVHTKSYVGIYEWQSDVTFHSFKVSFPNPMDNADEKICSAFIYNQADGDCYGYYGDDYAVIESSVSADTQNKYVSGILYPSGCATTEAPTTQEPTVVPHKPSTTNHTAVSTENNSLQTTLFPELQSTVKPATSTTINPSKALTANTSNVPTENPIEEPLTSDSIGSFIYVNEEPLYTSMLPFQATETLPDITISESPETEVEPQNTSTVKYIVIVVVLFAITFAIFNTILTYHLYKYFRQKRHQKNMTVIEARSDTNTSAQKNRGTLCNVVTLEITSRNSGEGESDTKVVKANHTAGEMNNIKEDEFVVQGDDEIGDTIF